ncbi:DUF1178 family protein [Pseudophaeobacter flagellatus]|uniref:DUF1178 family protein n=1 Tax=Pseudophaeobacter flagellatus TaxID=2899119 RepID=UPI001E4B0D67|nr:DUF1178 family protein [Pseudophaeobacter flagellatus]MCD9148453.1 DUF1178 family protein [Pseudophaeobacter flagellatus]
MINYSLKCAEGHSFDSWFQSASAFDKLASAGLVTCSFCGSAKVEKAIMAPRVRTGRKAVSGIGEPEQGSTVSDLCQQGAGSSPHSPVAAAMPTAKVDPAISHGTRGGPVAGPGALSAPAEGQAAELQRALRVLRRQVEANSDYVGKDFASEARAMHLGDTPERAIYGEAKPEEAKALIEEGIPVLPLPFGRNRKTN